MSTGAEDPPQGKVNEGPRAEESPRDRAKRDSQGPARGGPRTSAGKKRSSKNALRHGILCPDPTAGGESPEVFRNLVDGLRAHFHPRGVYEEELIALAAADLIGLHRIVRETGALIDLRFKRISPPHPASLLQSIVPSVQLNWSAYKHPLEASLLLERLDAHPDSFVIDPKVVDDAVRAIGATGLRLPKDRERLFAGVNDGIGLLRRLVRTVADVNGIEPLEVVKHAVAVLEEVVQAVLYADERVSEILAANAERDERLAAAHLPDLDDLERLLRYKRALERSYEQKIAMIEASQRARSGDLDPPIRVHVTEA